MYTLHDATGASYLNYIPAQPERADRFRLGDSVRIVDRRGDWVGRLIEPHLIELIDRVGRTPMHGSRPPLGSPVMPINHASVRRLLS